jgi:hypothetical protein
MKMLIELNYIALFSILVQLENLRTRSGKDFFVASKLWIWWPIKILPQIRPTRRIFENQKFVKENRRPAFSTGNQKLTVAPRTL